MTTESATQPGVQSPADDQTALQLADPAKPEGTDPPKETRTAREIAMDALEAVNHDKIDAELVKEGKPATREAPLPDPGDQLADQLAAGGAVLDGEALTKTHVKVKIDGVEKLVPIASLAAEYQKHGAADIRLEKASQLLREARAATGQPPAGNDDGNPAAHSPAPSATPGATPAPGAIDARKKLVTALFEGDEETALAAIDEAFGAGRQQPIPIEQLATQLAPVLKQQMSDEDALTQFGKDYRDIATDPYLATMADQIIEQEQAKGIPFAQALENSGKHVRGWLQSKGVAPAPTPSPSTVDRNSKLALKEGIDTLPTLNRSATNVEEPEESRSSVIAQMQKDRGLA